MCIPVINSITQMIQVNITLYNGEIIVWYKSSPYSVRKHYTIGFINLPPYSVGHGE